MSGPYCSLNSAHADQVSSLYTTATYVEGLDDDTVTGAPPTFGTLMCICEQAIGGKGSDEKVVFGIVAAQPSTGEVIYDRTRPSVCNAGFS